MADIFTQKQPGNPNVPAAGTHFLAGPRGWIPTSAALERTCGVYVAFTRPTFDPATGAPREPHRITLVDGLVTEAQEGREAFEAGRIELIHDLVVLDVDVRLGGRYVTEGDEFTLFPFQRACLEAQPGGSRKYDVSLLRPTDGDIRRVDGEISLTTEKTVAMAAPEPAEICRVYRYAAGTGFVDSGLSGFGLHLPGDVFIPVRRFAVKVDTELPVRAAPDPDAAAVTTPFKPGQQAYLLVPVRIIPSSPARQNPTLTVAYTGAVPAESRPPRLAFDFQAADNNSLPTLRTMLKFGGRIVMIPFPEDDPPEEEAQIDVTIDVGRGADRATLTAEMTLTPHFRLILPAAGNQVAPGDSLTLRCEDDAGNPANAGEVVITPAEGIQEPAVAGAEVTITVDAGAATGPRQVLVADAADSSRKARRTIVVAA